MPVELRKRKAPASAPAPAPAPKKSFASKAGAAVKKAFKGSNGEVSASGSKPAVGENITLEGFGKEIETNDGKQVTLKQLVEESKAGVVLFTYPKASTPGCTTQACLFRDSYAPLTATGFAIYGLSTDSPKANTTFKTKQNLPYPLLCDPNATLIGAIGLKKAPKGTTRGVFVVDKAGKVLAAEPGGPAATVDVVRKLVGQSSEPPAVENGAPKQEIVAAVGGGKSEAKLEAPLTKEPSKEDKEQASVAADVADTAQKLDGETPKVE